jgi:hypothetical protein
MGAEAQADAAIAVASPSSARGVIIDRNIQLAPSSMLA